MVVMVLVVVVMVMGVVVVVANTQKLLPTHPGLSAPLVHPPGGVEHPVQPPPLPKAPASPGEALRGAGRGRARRPPSAFENRRGQPPRRPGGRAAPAAAGWVR
eukprot:TRINITY_DN11313_c0_g1_i7.p2 TRINITY_DN11313_c0_g1~~TRINITY_DN11313_c0_g1_i7.p2  ORF type:complete len:103 (-),score=6.67 TRINITY_DN11313_c0_g1_i7:302-610(-)